MNSTATTYVAKHPFRGNAAQSQLSFPAGATITARQGQQGNAWWWGSYLGKEGWFPPNYVTPLQPNVINQAPSPATMQQRMQQASFTSSTAHRQQQQQQQQQQYQMNSASASGAANTTPRYAMNMQQQQQQRQVPSMQMQSPTSGMGMNNNMRNSAMTTTAGNDDPFAGLDNAPAPSLYAPSTAAAAATTAAAASVTPVLSPSVSRGNSTSSEPTLSMQQQIPQMQRQTTAPSPVNRAPTSVQTPTNNAYRAPVTSASHVASVATPTALASASRASSSSKTPTATNSSTPKPPTPTLKQDSQQKQMIERQMAQKRAAEDAAKKKSEEEEKKKQQAAWEKKVAIERQQRQRQASTAASSEKSATAAAAAAAASNLKVDTSSGLGVSGSMLTPRSSPQNVPQLSSEKIVSGPPMIHPNSKGSLFFNPYEFLTGEAKGEPNRKFNPIYRVQPFWALMNLETYVRKFTISKEQLETAAQYEQLTKALSFVNHIVQENEKVHGPMKAPLSYLRSNQIGCEACIKLIALLPHSAGASGKQLDTLFLNYINIFVSHIGNIKANQQIVIPGGWQTPDHTHLCLYIVRNCGDGTFSFTVCNTGEGLQYHPSKTDQATGQTLRQLALTIWDIPSKRLMDSSFWTILFRLQVYPSKKNDAEFLYTRLLPALNSRPLRSNLDLGPGEFMEVPDAILAKSYHFLARLALTTIPANGARPSRYSSLILMNSAIELCYLSIAHLGPSSMDPEDSRILKLSGRNLANHASNLDMNSIGDGTLGATLSSCWEMLDKLLKKLNYAASKAIDQHSHGLSKEAETDAFSKGTMLSLKVEEGSAAHPFFGRIRTDNYDQVVKELMGEMRPDPILIPAVLTDESMPSVATDYQNASSSLQRLCDACSLLLQQRHLIKNSPAFVASAAQYALTVSLPMPDLDPKACFWRKSPMRRETQNNLLFLIRRMCRIYSAATTRVQQSRGLIAIRSIAFACAACTADAISRVVATDDPSPFSLHYSGLNEGPTSPFGIEAGSFETLAANLPIFDAHYTSLRFKCLDYLKGLTVHEDGSMRHTIFNFDQSLIPMQGDIELINQLSIQLALPRPYPPTEKANIAHAAPLIAGTNGSVIEVLPDFECFRDIVFHFKHSVSGKCATPPDVEESYTWLPHHATLKWTVKPFSAEDNTPVYTVYAFRATHQEFVDPSATKSSTKSAFSSFLSFFGKSQTERSKLSAADPTNIVNSCGEKFLKGRYVSVLVIFFIYSRKQLTAFVLTHTKCF